MFLAAVWAFVAFGAARMMTLRSYGIGLAAAIVSIVNCSGHLWCCCWPLGIAFGIWSLVVLLQPNVRAAFA